MRDYPIPVLQRVTQEDSLGQHGPRVILLRTTHSSASVPCRCERATIPGL